MFSDKLKKKKMPFGTLEPSLSTSTPHNASVGRKSLFLQALSHNSSVNKFPQLNFSTKKKTCTVNGKTKLQSCSEGSESFPDAGNEQSDCDITVDESEEEWLPPGGHSLCDIDKNLTDIPAAEEMCQYPNEGQGLANEADAAPSTGKSILDICSHQQECRANALKWGLWRCPVLSELIRGLTDACAYHQWDLVLALLPCIAVRSFPMLSLQYSVEMATALESCGGLQAENVHPQLRLLAPNKTVQLLSSIVQHCSKKNQATSSGLHEPPTLSNVLDTSQPMDVNTEAILQEWDKLLKDEDNVVRHKGLSKMDRYFIEAYKGILCYVRWKKMEENRELSSIQTNPLHCTTSPDPSFINSDTEDVADFALRELTKDVSPEDLADQSVVLMEEAFDAIAEPCEWLLLPLLESLEKSRGTTASHAAACKYLKRHPSHAPAFRAVLQHALAHWPTQTSTHVAIMKHVQLLSPGTEQVLTLAQTLLDDPRSYDTTSAEAAMGLTPLSREAAADDTSLRVSTVCASASEDLCNSSLVVRRKGQASVVACPLLKDVVVQSRVYCVRVLVRLLHVPHHQHALRPWELLSRALASLHRSWIRCWNCSGCRRSRQDLVPVVTMWWWLWWRDLVLAHSGAGLPSTGVHLKCDADAKLMLNRAVVAHILCIDASSDVWWSALSSSGWSGLAEELQQSVFRSGPHAHDFTQHRASVMRRHQEMFGKNVSSSVHLRPPIRAKFVKQVSFADHQAAERTSLNGTEQSDAAQNLQPNALPSNGEQANSPKESATRIEAITDASGPTGVGDMSGRSAVEKELNDLASGGNWSVERQRILEQRLMGGEKPSASTWAIPTFPAAKSARVKLGKKLERDDEKVINLRASLASPIISRIAPLVVSDSEDCNSQNNAFQVGKKASSIPNVGPKKRPRSKIKPKDDHSATAAGKSSIEIKSKASGVQSSSRRRQPAAPRQKKASKAGKGKEDPEAMSTCLSERQQNSACLASPEVQIESISEQNLNSAKNSSLESIEKKTRCLRNRGGTVENGSVPPIEDYESGAANRRCEGNTGKEMSQNFPKSNCDVESTDAMLASQSIPCGQLVSSRRLSFSLQRKGDSNSLTNQNLSMNIDNCLDEILKPTDTDVRDVDQFSETSEDPLSPDIIPASSEYEISDLFIPKLFTTKSQSNFSGSANSPQNISSDKGISNVEERDQDSKTSVKRCEKLPEKSPLLSLSVTETQSVVSNSNAPENSFSKPLKNWDGSREDANNDETAFSNVNQSGSHERSGIREVGEVKDECKEETQDFLNEKSSFVPIVGNSRLRRKLAPAHRIACQDPGDSEGSLITESNPCYNHADREDFLTKRKKTSPEGVVCKIEKPDEATTRVLSARLLTTPSDRHPEEGSLTRSEGRLPDSTVISSPEIRDLNSVTDGGSGGRKQSKKRKKDLDDYDGPAINKNESGENENRKKTKSVKATSENVHSSFVAQGMAGIEGNMVTAKPSKKKKRNKSADEAPSLQPIPANKKNRYETSISHRDNDRKLGKNIEKPVQFSSSIIYSFDSVETDREQEKPKDSLKVKKAKTKKRGSGEHSGESCAALVQVSTPNSRAPEPRIVSVQEEWNSIFQQPTKPKVSSRERLENLASVESPLRPHQKSVEIYEAKTQIAKVSKKKTKRANEAPRELTNEEMIADFEKFALREYNCDLSKC